MSRKKRFGVSEAISRGLSETIHVVENNAGTFRNVMLPLSRIELDPDNPRKLAITLADIRNGLDMTDSQLAQKQIELQKLKELAVTIESSGIINPVVVYKHSDLYRVVAGERRCLASILAGREEIDARVFNEKPKPFDLKLMQWVENTAREDLTLAERIENIRDIIREYEKQGYSETVSATVLKEITGLSLSQTSYYLTVLHAPEDIQAAIYEGRINSLDKAAVIASVASVSLRHHLLLACMEGCSLKTLRKMITENKRIEKTAKHKSQSTLTKRGRITSRVNLGVTRHTPVVKTIVHAVLAEERYKKYVKLFADVDWNHYDHAATAFRQLIDMLEHEITG